MNAIIPVQEVRKTTPLVSVPCLNQLSANDPPWRVVPAVEAVAGDKGQPDQTETQGETNQRLNHRTRTPDFTFNNLPIVKV